MDRRTGSFVVTEGFQLAFRRGDQAGKHGFNRCHDHGADQYHGHRAALGVKNAHGALVAGEQLRHVFGGGLVDREQAARHVDHLAQGAGQWHVHAVVVLGRQVNGGELAAHELRRNGRVATDQFQHAVAVAFGLEYTTVLDRPQLADSAIGRAQHRTRGLIQRARAVFQGTGEEGVEVLVGGDVFNQGLGHVHLITLGEPAGERILEPAHAAFGNAAGQA